MIAQSGPPVGRYSASSRLTGSTESATALRSDTHKLSRAYSQQKSDRKGKSSRGGIPAIGHSTSCDMPERDSEVCIVSAASSGPSKGCSTHFSADVSQFLYFSDIHIATEA